MDKLEELIKAGMASIEAEDNERERKERQEAEKELQERWDYLAHLRTRLPTELADHLGYTDNYALYPQPGKGWSHHPYLLLPGMAPIRVEDNGYYIVSYYAAYGEGELFVGTSESQYEKSLERALARASLIGNTYDTALAEVDKVNADRAKARQQPRPELDMLLSAKASYRMIDDGYQNYTNSAALIAIAERMDRIASALDVLTTTLCAATEDANSLDNLNGDTEIWETGKA